MGEPILVGQETLCLANWREVADPPLRMVQTWSATLRAWEDLRFLGTWNAAANCFDGQNAWQTDPATNTVTPTIFTCHGSTWQWTYRQVLQTLPTQTWDWLGLEQRRKTATGSSATCPALVLSPSLFCTSTGCSLGAMLLLSFICLTPSRTGAQAGGGLHNLRLPTFISAGTVPSVQGRFHRWLMRHRKTTGGRSIRVATAAQQRVVPMYGATWQRGNSNTLGTGTIRLMGIAADPAAPRWKAKFMAWITAWTLEVLSTQHREEEQTNAPGGVVAATTLR